MTTLLTVVEDRDVPGHVPPGPIGRRLAAQLIAEGQPTRVLLPASQASGWPDSAELVIGDVTRPADAAHAFRNIRRLFLSGAVPETAYELVTMAREGGAERIVTLSSHGPEFEIQCEPEGWYWLAVEVVVERSGARWTHLRPSPVMAQTLSRTDYPRMGSNWRRAIRNGEVIRAAYADVRYPFIDEDDLAGVAAAVLADDQYGGQAVRAYGPLISARERAHLIGKALGRAIPFEEITPEQAAEQARCDGVPEELIELAHSVSEDLQSNPWEPNHTVERILGRPPRSYGEWLVDNVEAAHP